jgi:hypothetical protein
LSANVAFLDSHQDAHGFVSNRGKLGAFDVVLAAHFQNGHSNPPFSYLRDAEVSENKGNA